MKYIKIMISTLLTLLFCANVYAGDVELGKSNTAGRYHLFTGFEFGSYVPSPVGLDAEIADSYLKIRGNESEKAADDYYSIVGHSQGGLRVMAYSTYLKNQSVEDYNKLQAVITVSGIDKGLLALDGGFSVVKAKVMADVSTIYYGLTSVACAALDYIEFLIPNPLTEPAVLYFAHNDYLNPSIESTTNWMLNKLPDNYTCYVKPALAGADPDSMAEIRDMFPRSGFNKKYVSDSKRHDYKVQTGTESYLDWCVVKSYKVCGKRIRIWGFQWKTKPVYTWYTAWEDFPKFGEEMPYGYIVGLNSNSLSMLPDEQGARKALDKAELAFNAAYCVHSVESWIPLVGWVMNSSTNAHRAKDARNYVRNFDNRLNRLKGSDENDGLVAKESQYFPKSFSDPNTGEVRLKHQNVLGNDPKGFIAMPQYNHIAIDPDTNTEVQAVIEKMMIEAVFRRIR